MNAEVLNEVHRIRAMQQERGDVVARELLADEIVKLRRILAASTPEATPGPGVAEYEAFLRESARIQATPEPDECDRCNGGGVINVGGEMESCDYCGGTGKEPPKPQDVEREAEIKELLLRLWEADHRTERGKLNKLISDAGRMIATLAGARRGAVADRELANIIDRIREGECLVSLERIEALGRGNCDEAHVALAVRDRCASPDVAHLRAEGWISVNDRLPDKLTDHDSSANVLATDGKQVFVMAYCYVVDGKYWQWGMVYDGLDGEPHTDEPYDDITHWQPIPKPYRANAGKEKEG